MVSWGGPPSSPGAWEVGWGVPSGLLRLALVAVLLASEPLPSPHRPLSPSPSSVPFPLSHCSTWKLHGPLYVCVHVCACIYLYREIYMGAKERVEEVGAAQGWEPGHCPLSSTSCSSHAGEIKGRRWRGGCPTPVQVPLHCR